MKVSGKAVETARLIETYRSNRTIELTSSYSTPCRPYLLKNETFNGPFRASRSFIITHLIIYNIAL